MYYKRSNKFEDKANWIENMAILVVEFQVWGYKFRYSQVPIKQVGPNKQVGWIFYVNFMNK